MITNEVALIKLLTVINSSKSNYFIELLKSNQPINKEANQYLVNYKNSNNKILDIKSEVIALMAFLSIPTANRSNLTSFTRIKYLNRLIVIAGGIDSAIANNNQDKIKEFIRDLKVMKCAHDRSAAIFRRTTRFYKFVGQIKEKRNEQEAAINKQTYKQLRLRAQFLIDDCRMMSNPDRDLLLNYLNFAPLINRCNAVRYDAFTKEEDNILFSVFNKQFEEIIVRCEKSIINK